MPTTKCHELAAGIGVTTVGYGEPGLCNHDLLLDTYFCLVASMLERINPKTRYSNFVFDYSDRSTSDQP